jgi:hypothetical protein
VTLRVFLGLCVFIHSHLSDCNRGTSVGVLLKIWAGETLRPGETCILLGAGAFSDRLFRFCGLLAYVVGNIREVALVGTDGGEVVGLAD